MMKWLWVSALVITLDLATKAMATHYLVLYRPLPMFPGFNFTLAHNAGAAFSFLSDQSGWQRWFFSAIALVVSVGLVVWIKRLEKSQMWLALALALILGGALGNLWDRMTLGYVVDFIEVYYQRWTWPAFNIADSAIFLGAVILVADSIWGGPHGQNDDEAGTASKEPRSGKIDSRRVR
ncbi:MAG: lipoprotein signal peptidase [Gammaproteobacteria bacterium]|nr:lipoprotein signal peptidase [Gammaproteobacteria bacterium]